MLSCFINSIFNSFVISYWVYFVVIERKKKIKKNDKFSDLGSYLKQKLLVGGFYGLYS